MPATDAGSVDGEVGIGSDEPVVAVVPAIVVAMVYGALVTRAVDNWFSERVAAVVENSAKVDKSYVDEQLANLGTNLTQMTGEVTDIAGSLRVAPIRFSQALGQLASLHGFAAAYVIDADGRVLARIENPQAPPFVLPPPSAFKTAERPGDIDAQNALGASFYQGEGVTKDLAVARKLFESAATQGQRDAMFNLAAMLMKGEGGDADLVRAWVWFKLAETGRHRKAAAAARAIEARMSDAEKQTAATYLGPARAG